MLFDKKIRKNSFPQKKYTISRRNLIFFFDFVNLEE